MKRYIPSEKVLERKYDKVVDANIKLVDEMRYLKDEKERLKEELENEKNAYNRMYNMYTEKEQEIERLKNIVNEIEKYLYNEWIVNRDSKYDSLYYKAEEDREVLDKLQELEGNDKVE